MLPDGFALLLDSMPDAVVVADAGGVIRLFNRQAEVVFGYERDAVVGASIDILLPERSRGTHAFHRQRYMSAPSTRPMGAGRELIAQRADGREFPAEVSLSAITAGDDVYVSAAVRDVSERKQIEATLRQSEELFRSVAATAPVGIFRTDVHGRCTYVNQRWLTITGRSLVSAMGDVWLEAVHPAERDDVSAAWWASTDETGEYAGQFRVQGIDGRVRWVAANAAALRVGGVVTGFVGSITDITAQVEAEAALATARDEALAASRMKSEFLANMSHEIRTPMNGVLGMAEMLLDADLTPTQRRYATALRTAGTHLLQIINDILDFSKIEAGKLRMEAVDFDLRADVEEVASLLSASATDKGVALELAIDPRVPAFVRSDPVRIGQVLTNLVANAVKFTEQGRVELRLSADDRGNGMHRVRFEVIDTGIGIAPDAKERLLDPFSQADASTTRRYGGTGLGLAICRQLVDLLGGTLGFDSEVGEGSTFWFDLLLEARPTPTPDPPRTERRFLPAGVPDPSSSRALLVEDNPINQLVAKAMLEKVGYRVDIANDGSEAVASVAREVYDVVLMDCQMPVMDGFEATRRIRSMADPASRTPIIAMTAAAMAGDRERCLAVGMDDYVAKPVTGDALTAALERAQARRGPVGAPSVPDGPPGDAMVAPEVSERASILETAATLAAEVGGDAFGEAVELFLRSGPDRLASIAAALAAGDAGAAGAAAHSLKGSAATFGAVRLAETCQRIDAACRNHDLDGARQWGDVLGTGFTTAREALEATVRSH